MNCRMMSPATRNVTRCHVAVRRGITVSAAGTRVTRCPRVVAQTPPMGDAPSQSPSGQNNLRSKKPTKKTSLNVAAPIAPPAPITPDKEAPKETRKIRVRIDNVWYDMSGWAAAHPGGARWIRWFDGRDATAVFYALHSYGPNGSDVSMRRLQKLPRFEAPEDVPGRYASRYDTTEQGGTLPTADDQGTMEAFQELRVKLEKDGYFKRDILKEAWALVSVLALYGLGTAVAFTHPIAATLLLGLGMQQAGWLAHDYIHGRGAWCDNMRWFGAVFNGHSAEWWAQKHSLHHCFTNEEELDHDIMMEPFFFMRSPTESGRPDSPWRKYQHIYGYPLISIMYWLWRAHSVQCVFERKDVKEAALLSVNYLWLALCMPWQVAVGSIFVGGFLVGGLVSATHQSEEIMLAGDQPDYIAGQFRSTRDAEAQFGPIETWLWGGMDTQLTHHLLPSLPRYKYHEVRPIIIEWARSRGIEYRMSPSTKILSDNFATLKRVALQ